MNFPHHNKKYNVQHFLRIISRALHKNYLYNQDKYRYAKSITGSYVSWLRFSFSENVISHAYMFYNKPYKFKRLLTGVSAILTRKERYFRFFLNSIHTTLIVGLSIGIYYGFLKIYEYLKIIDEIMDAALIVNYDIKNQNNRLLGICQEFLRKLTSKHVFYNEKLNFSTAKLIAEVCAKPNIEAFIGKCLRELLEKEVIIKGTQNLATIGLHKSLLHEEFLYGKFKILVFNQIRKENLRKELLKTITDFMKTDYSSNVFNSQLAAAIRNRQVLEIFVDGCKNKALDAMDNDHYKSMASQKLRNMEIF